MAISNDTAALVAAQLTVAWATRIGSRQGDPRLPFDKEIGDVYSKFLDEVIKAVPSTPFDMRKML